MPTTVTLPNGRTLEISSYAALQLRCTRQQNAIRSAQMFLRLGDVETAQRYLEYGEADLGTDPPTVARDLAANRPSMELDAHVV